MEKVVGTDNGKVIGGAILLVISIWIFITMMDFTARYIGASILAILALALLIDGLIKR